jgi:hypothetical protein
MNQFNAASGTWNQFFLFSVRSFLLDNATNNKNVDCRHIVCVKVHHNPSFGGEPKCHQDHVFGGEERKQKMKKQVPLN